MIYHASGPGGTLGCGIILIFLGLFILTPVGMLLIKGIAWALVALGLLTAGLAALTWFHQRR